MPNHSWVYGLFPYARSVVQPLYSARLFSSSRSLSTSILVHVQPIVWHSVVLAHAASTRLLLPSHSPPRYPSLLPILPPFFFQVLPNVSAGVQSLQRMVPAGRNFITLNGGSLNLESVDLFS